MLKRFKHNKSNDLIYKTHQNIADPNEISLEEGEIFINTELPMTRLEYIREQMNSAEAIYRSQTPSSLSIYNSSLLSDYKIIVNFYLKNDFRMINMISKTKIISLRNKDYSTLVQITN